MINKVTLAEKLSLFSEHWSPKIVGELNRQQVKLVKFQGEFVWHKHDREDELFFVLKGRFRMEFRDRLIELETGKLLIVPRGVEQRPVADHEVDVLRIEPAQKIGTASSQRQRLLTTLIVGDGGWVALPEPFIVKTGDAFVATCDERGAAT